jgi:MarR family transcriptional regulator for hemolysin
MVWAHGAKRLYSKRMEPLTKEFDLPPVEMEILLFLHEHPWFDSSRDIAEYLLLAKSNVSNAVENLVQRGYLRRRADLKDRRLVHLELLDPAQILVSRGEDERKKLFTQLFAGFSAEEMEMLWKFRKRISANVQNMLRE